MAKSTAKLNQKTQSKAKRTSLVITGTPGTGKTTLAKGMAKLLGAELINSNREVNKIKAYTLRGGEKEVKLSKLHAHLKKLVSKAEKEGKSIILEGHILCEFGLPVDKVLVLRCEPRKLEKRLKKRKYSKEKVRGNVLSEALDYCLIKAEANYGEKQAVEANNTKFITPKKAQDAAIGAKTGQKQFSARWLRSLPTGFLEQNL